MALQEWLMARKSLAAWMLPPPLGVPAREESDAAIGYLGRADSFFWSRVRTTSSLAVSRALR